MATIKALEAELQRQMEIRDRLEARVKSASLPLLREGKVPAAYQLSRVKAKIQAIQSEIAHVRLTSPIRPGVWYLESPDMRGKK